MSFLSLGLFFCLAKQHRPFFRRHSFEEKAPFEFREPLIVRFVNQAFSQRLQMVVERLHRVKSELLFKIFLRLGVLTGSHDVPSLLGVNDLAEKLKKDLLICDAGDVFQRSDAIFDFAQLIEQLL